MAFVVGSAWVQLQSDDSALRRDVPIQAKAAADSAATDVKVGADTSALQRDLPAQAKAAAAAADATVNVKANVDQAGIRAFETQVAAERPTIDVQATVDEAGVRAFEARVSAERPTVNIQAAVDEAGVRAFEARVSAERPTVNVQASVDDAGVRALEAKIAASKPTVTIGSRVDEGEITSVIGRLNAVGSLSETVNYHAKVDEASLAAVIVEMNTAAGLATKQVKVQLDVDNASLATTRATLDAIGFKVETVKVKTDLDQTSLIGTMIGLDGAGKSGGGIFSGAFKTATSSLVGAGGWTGLLTSPAGIVAVSAAALFLAPVFATAFIGAIGFGAIAVAVLGVSQTLGKYNQAQKDVTDGSKELTAAQQQQQVAQDRVNQLTASGGLTVERAQAALNTANQAVTAATAGHGNLAAAQAKQKIAQDALNVATGGASTQLGQANQALAEANQKVADATQKVADAKSTIASAPDGITAFQGALTGLATTAKNTLADLSRPFITPLAAAVNILTAEFGHAAAVLAPGFQAISTAVVPLTKGLAGLVDNLLPGFEKALLASAPVLEEIGKLLPGLGKALGAFLEQMAKLATSQGGIDALRGAFAILDAAITGIAIGLTVLVQVFSWFDTAVRSTANFFKGPFMDAFNATAAWFSGPFVGFFKAIGNWFTGPFVGFFVSIGAWFTGPFLAPFNAVGAWFTGPFVGFFTGTWNAVSRTATGFWQTLVGTFTSIKNDLTRIVGDATGWIERTAANTWNAVSRTATGFWQTLVGTFTSIKNDLTRIVGDVMGWIARTAASTWNTVMSDVNKFFVTPIQNAFISTVEGIKRLWTGLKAVVLEPVNFIVETVYDKGILGFWNKIADIIHWGHLDPVHFAEGGVVPGAPGVVGDNVPIYATAGEGMVSLSGMRNLEKMTSLPASEALDMINGNRIGGTQHEKDGARHYWWGGTIINDALKAVNKVESVARGYLGSVVNPVIDAVKHTVDSEMPGNNNMAIGMMQHGVDSLLDRIKAFVSADDVAHAATGIGLGSDNSYSYQIIEQWVKSIWPSAMVTSDLRAYGSASSPTHDYHTTGQAADFVTNGTTTMENLAAKLQLFAPSELELIHNPNASVKNGKLVPPSFWGAETWDAHANHVHIAARKDAIDALLHPQQHGGAGAAPPGQVTDWIRQGLGYWNLADNQQWLSGLYSLAMQESAGNPNAINLTDSNAAAGHPSKGLLQFIDSTFQANAQPGHGNIWNPVDQVIADVPYINHRYGSILNVPGLVSVRAGGGYVGYAAGVKDAPAGLAMVGERGPELMNFKGGESVEPLHTTTITIQTLNVNANNADDFLADLKRLARAGTR